MMRRWGWHLSVLMAVGWWPAGAGADETWDEAGSRKLVEKMLVVEKAGSPWNKIQWVKDGTEAEAKAKKSGKPILLFFHLAKGGPKAEPCGPGGRVMRALGLADPKVQALIRKEFVALKVGLNPGADFPLDWPVLEGWKRLFQFADGRTFTGCVVVSAGCEVEFGTTGSLLLWELVDTKGFDAGKLREVLKLAAARGREERLLRTQAGITEAERVEELRRFRQGLARAAKDEGRFQVPPPGFSIQKVMAWFAVEN